MSAETTREGKARADGPEENIQPQAHAAGRHGLAASGLSGGSHGRAGAARASTHKRRRAGQPNILVIWGDNIGTWNIGHNNRGMMGYQTPNIDRIAVKGSLHRLLCPAELHGGARRLHQRRGPVRCGMTKVGLPGARKVGRRRT